MFFSSLEKRGCNKIIRESLLEIVYVLPNRIIDHGYDWADIFSTSF